MHTVGGQLIPTDGGGGSDDVVTVMVVAMAVTMTTLLTMTGAQQAQMCVLHDYWPRR